MRGLPVQGNTKTTVILEMKKILYALIFCASIMGCRKPYNPPVVANNGSYLVVEGVINSGQDSTKIKISRTVNISSVVTVNPVTGATLTVESDQNAVYPLTETGNGNYASPALNLDVTRQYRLRIKTSNNEYLSDFVPVNVTPPIDSISYSAVSIPDTGVQIYASTHNSNTNSRYYRWDYSETWRFHAEYSCLYISNGSNAIISRTPDQWRYFCFSSDSSSDIVLGSSAKLQNNVINHNPIALIPFTSEKIELEYSILLRQYSITANAYNFWMSLKTNTEQLGSIFDAQPSQITGNIHNVANAAEPVIGYVSVCSVQSKRIFISRYSLPDSWEPIYPYSCSIQPTGTQGPAFLYPLPNDFVPMDDSGSIFTSTVCADCTIRGTQTVPPFWKYL
jgi:hypothetical protein